MKCKCLNKAALAGIIQSGQAGAGGPTPVTIDAEITGFIDAAENESQQSIFGYATYDAATYGQVPVVGPLDGHNPQCDGEGITIGTLVIDPKLPATSDGTFDITYTFLDNSGGGGGMFIFCPSTGETAQLQSTGGSFGNNTGPVTNTLSFDASALNCPVEEVMVGINAWGVTSTYEDDRCDHLSAEVGTLTVVTPSACLPAIECFETLFGCSLSEMVQASGALDDLQSDVDGIEKTKIVWSLVNGEAGIDWAMWTGEKVAQHGPIDTIFTATGAGTWGTAGHVNGEPSITGTNNDFIFNDAQLIGTVEARPSDQLEAWGFKKIPADGFIQDVNGNSGETGQVFCGIADGCWNSKLALIADRTANTTGADRGIMGPVPVVAGSLPMLVKMSDFSAFQGFQLQWAPTAEGPWENLVGDACRTPPKWVARVEPCSYVLQEGETLVPPPQCCPTPSL